MTSDSKKLSKKSSQSKEDESVKKKLNDKSDTCLQNDEIYRKFRVSVKQTEDYINRINKLSENRIQERCANILLEERINQDVDHSKEILNQIQHDYLIEVDKSLDDRAQLRAQRQYHATHIESLLPEWCKILIKVKEVIGGYGHINKLQWRSKAKSLLVNSLSLMEQEEVTPAIQEAIDIIRHYIRSINAHNAQHILMVIKGVKERYLKAIDSDVEGTLGHHCRKLREIDEKLLQKPVPLLREEWSQEILSELNKKSTLESTSILKRTTSPVSLSQMETPHSPIKHHPQKFSSPESSKSFEGHSVFSSVCNEEKTKGHIGERFMDDIQIGYPSEFTTFHQPSIASSSTPVTSLPLLFPPPEKISNLSTANLYLRSLATKGQFTEAWGVFNALYGEYIVYPVHRIQDKSSISSPSKKISMKETHFLKTNLRSKPTLETFKLLFLALKNSPTYDSYDIYTLLNLMKRLEIIPDIIIYNTVLRICEKVGAWRRALEFLHHMEDNYDHLLPNTNTYNILADCCRHSVESPAVIFETLRHAGLPRK